MAILFVSDLHLHENRPLVTEAFFSFIDRHLLPKDTLYILGDFFDTWIGDDDDSDLSRHVAKRLSVLKQSGVHIFFQHGNRDFLLGSSYAKKCGMQLLSETEIVVLNGKRWLLAHGDQFCTRDIPYQQFRKLARNPQWQADLLKKTLAERQTIAAQLREKSREANSLKAEEIMDVTPEEIQAALTQNQCHGIIHGHTHRPARHTINDLHGMACERIVLGEWDQSLWFLYVSEAGIELMAEKILP